MKSQILVDLVYTYTSAVDQTVRHPVIKVAGREFEPLPLKLDRSVHCATFFTIKVTKNSWWRMRESNSRCEFAKLVS